MNDDHAALRFEQMNVVDDFGAAAVHVEDGLAHQVLVQQHPAGMIDEGGILVAGVGRLDEDGVVVDLHHAIPGDELGRVAPAVFDVDADGLGIGLAERKHEVGQPSDAVLDLAGADGAIQAGRRNRGSDGPWWPRKRRRASASLRSLSLRHLAIRKTTRETTRKRHRSWK